MTKKQLLICAAIVALYLSSFFITKIYLKTEKTSDTTTKPFIVLPRCAKNAIAIGITSESNTVCEAKNGISVYSADKETVILPVTEISKDSMIISRQNYLILISSQKIFVKEILSNLTLLDRGNIELAQNESFLDVFLSSDDTQDVLLLSTELKATSPSDNKSQIRIVAISKKENAANLSLLNTIPSKYIDAVLYANFSVPKPFIITRTAYPFLELRYKVLQLADQKVEEVTQCTITKILPAQESPLWEQQCPGNPASEVKSTDTHVANDINAISMLKKGNSVMFQNSFLIFTADHDLIWKSNEKISHLLDDIPSTIDTFNIISRQGTRIGKRVYNCIDFGDSPQISLRVCIPFYD